MSTDDTSNHGFFVRTGHHGPLHHAAARNPKAALAAIDALHLCDGDCVWIWRAASVRSDIENSSVGALGPVGDPRVFEVRIGLIELNEGFSDPEDILKAMLAESEKSDAPSYPRAPNISSCVYDAARHVFVVMFENERTETLFGSRVKREDGTPVPPGAVRGCDVDEFRRGVLVKLEDGSETSFSANLVLYETDPDFRAQVDAASKASRVANIVHILVDGASMCGYEAARLPARDAGCSAAEADRLATCHPCLAGWAARRTSGERTLVPAGDGRVVCPGCEKVRPELDADLPRERWQPMLDAYLPCCNPECGGYWGTGCWHCHHPKFWDERSGRRAEREQIEVLTSHGVTVAAATVQVRTLGGDARVPTKAWCAGSEDGRVFCFYADGPHQVYASLDDARVAHPGTEWEVASLTAPLSTLPRQPLSVSHRSFGPGETRGGIEIVHVLIGGTPLCGFMAGTVPGDWPKGHTWCHVEQAPEKSNCATCLVKALTRVPTPEVTEPAQLDTSEEDESARERRIEDEVRRALAVSDTQLRPLARTMISALWAAVDDLDEVRPGLHPMDVIQKYLQRGNIRKDGQW